MLLDDLIAKMPKVELHVHLEGSIRPETLLKLARRNDVDLPAHSVEELREWYRFRSFEHFVEVYVQATRCLRTPEDLVLVGREFVSGLLEQNVRWVEVTYTAETIERVAGIRWEDQLEALRTIRQEAAERGLGVGFILDIVREVPEEAGRKIADWAIGAADVVCGLGLSGVEAGTPARRHAEAFRRAKAAGLGISAHAGETSGPQAIWDALEIGADRIGHGIACLRDEALVTELRARQIPLEVCPTSNLRLCGIAGFEAHPLGEMERLGLNVSVNSDDPPMFDTTLTLEWQRAVRAYGWGVDRIRELSRRSAGALFAPREAKQALIEQLGFEELTSPGSRRAPF